MKPSRGDSVAVASRPARGPRFSVGTIRIVLLTAALLTGGTGCGSDDEGPEFGNPLDPVNRPDLPIPTTVVAAAGSDRVRISWEIPAGSSVDEFAIFRRRVDEAGLTIEKQSLVGRTTVRFFEDTRVRNGLRYVYNVASGERGTFGGRSVDAAAAPALFTLVLNDDAPATRDRLLAVQFVAPTGTEAAQLFESATPPPTDLDPGVPWRPLGQGTTWTLSPGDGLRRVYARFRLPDGSISLPVADDIRLDTSARISEFTFDGAATRPPGDPIHFRLVAGEPGGTASVEVAGLFLIVALFDDGTNGDPLAGDGIYEVDTRVPGGQTILGSVVIGRFTDELGNVALAAEADRRLSVQVVPDAVSLSPPSPALPPAPAGVLLEWAVSPAADFAAYRVSRSEIGAADPAPRTLTLITLRGQAQYLDNAVQEGVTYSYQVAVVSNGALEGVPSAATVTVPNLRPPGAVTLQPADGVSTSRALIRWTRSVDLDFAAYRLYRSRNGAVDESATLVRTLTSPDATSTLDDALEENSSYHYRIFVVDRGGFVSGSNEILVRTQNLAPPPVLINPATAITATGVTISWGASDIADFRAYRLYRSETPNVTTAATLIKEVEERSGTSFRDTTVRGATTFYYRVYVVDNGIDPGPLSSGSNTISVTTPAN